MKDEEWEMKSGKKIMVSEMEESHAKNCLCLLIRRIREHNSKRSLMAFHKDMDTARHEADLDQILHDDAGDRQ